MQLIEEKQIKCHGNLQRTEENGFPLEMCNKNLHKEIKRSARKNWIKI